MMNYQYFWHSSPTGDRRDLLRLDASTFDRFFEMHHFRIMERLLPDGSWVRGQNQTAERQWMHGWFDEDDAISEETARSLMTEWGITEV